VDLIRCGRFTARRNYQVLNKRAERERHFGVCRVDSRQPSRSLTANPHLSIAETHTPWLSVVTAGCKGGVVEDAVNVRRNERRRRRAWWLFHIPASHCAHTHGFMEDTNNV